MTEGVYLEPKTVYEANPSDDWDQWHQEVKDEVKALQDNETWNLVRPTRVEGLDYFEIFAPTCKPETF